MKAIRVHETGGSEKLLYEDISIPSAGPNQAVVKVHSIGLNFIDVYFRSGLYKSALPFTPGMEAAGTVEAVGEGVSDEPGSLIHGTSNTPRHRAIPPNWAALVCAECYLCARSILLPMSPVYTVSHITP